MAYLDAACLALRNLDHLFPDDSDILAQPKLRRTMASGQDNRQSPAGSPWPAPPPLGFREIPPAAAMARRPENNPPPPDRGGNREIFFRHPYGHSASGCAASSPTLDPSIITTHPAVAGAGEREEEGGLACMQELHLGAACPGNRRLRFFRILLLIAREAMRQGKANRWLKLSVQLAHGSASAGCAGKLCHGSAPGSMVTVFWRTPLIVVGLLLTR